MNMVPESFVHSLLYRAAHQPDQLAYTFLNDETKGETNLTYQELCDFTCAIAAKIQSQSNTGNRAILLFPAGIEFVKAFYACLFAGVVAVPVYPPHPNNLEKTLPKLLKIIEDAGPDLILTTSAIRNLSQAVFNKAFTSKNIKWIATDLVMQEFASDWEQQEVNENDIAFLQYTSGSTGHPKGVIISHKNLMSNSIQIKRCFQHTEKSQGVIWLPPYHDMGLIGGILQPLYCGFPVTLMTPIAFLRRPYFWLKAISDYKATTSGGPNFAYDVCVDRITPEERDSLDLSSWNLAFTGAEPINKVTIDRFTEYFEPCGFRREAFYPCYGLAEATLIASGGIKSSEPFVVKFSQSAVEQHILRESDGEDSSTFVACGSALPGHNIVIVNQKNKTRCKDDEIGEVWISGPSIAQGYWNKQQETQESFKVFIEDTGEGPFLRSGDLGFIKNNELFITGRIKDLIIIDGRNHYPQDIEWTISSLLPKSKLGIGICTAFSIQQGGEERLVIFIEMGRRRKSSTADAESEMPAEDGSTQKHHALSLEELATSIRMQVAENHDIRIHDIVFLKSGSTPKTSSGKIQRFVCRAMYQSNTLQSNVITE